jgi:tetratricopeptide (TPR) repeat protein
VLVTAQLIDGVTGAHLWAAEYPGDLSDVFAIQADIATNIANALEAEFSLAEQELIEQVPTESPAAYALYLSAISRIDIAERIAGLDQATSLDPDFALAYAEKAASQAISLLGFGGATSTQAAELERTAQANAQRALALDSTLGPAYAALANTHVANRRLAAAQEALEQALQSTPNDASILQEYARLYRYRGDYDQAIEAMQRAVALDPKNPNRLQNLGVAQRYARNYQAAAEASRAGLELSPTEITLHINLARAEVGLGNYAEALSVLGVVEALSVDTRPNSLRLSQMAVTYSQAGRSDEAMRIFNELEERAQEAPIGEAIWARANIAIGDYDQALQHLEAAIRDRVPTDVGTLAELAANVTNDPVLETDPRYRELLGGIWDDG